MAVCSGDGGARVCSSDVGDTFIKIGDLRLDLAYSPAGSPNSLREYIPKGESLDHWSRLASVRVFKNMTDPDECLQQVAAGVARRGPPAKAVIFKGPQGERYKMLPLFGAADFKERADQC